MTVYEYEQEHTDWFDEMESVITVRHPNAEYTE